MLIPDLTDGPTGQGLMRNRNFYPQGFGPRTIAKES